MRPLQKRIVPSRTMSEQISPQNRTNQDEISLVDLWLLLIRHRKIFWGLFAFTLICGSVYSLLKPAVYTVSSMIEIGSLSQNGQRVPIESTESVKAKLEMALGPSLLDNRGEDQQPLEFIITSPKNSNLVNIQNQVRNESVSSAKSLQEKLIVSLVNNHDRILNLSLSEINAGLSKAREQLHRLKDERLQQPERAAFKVQILEKKAKLTKLTDPVIQGYIKNELEIALAGEKQALASLIGAEVVLNAKATHLKRSRQLLERQIAEQQKQIDQRKAIDKLLTREGGVSSGAISLLIASNEFQQDRLRLAELEERLFVELENQESELQQEINENKRLQVHQANIIAQQETNKKKQEIEIQLEKDLRMIEVARAEADLLELDALHEQQVALKMLEIGELEVQLKNLIGTQAVTKPLRSRTATGSSSTRIIVISALLGILLGVFGIFIRVFILKAQSQQ